MLFASYIVKFVYYLNFKLAGRFCQVYFYTTLVIFRNLYAVYKKSILYYNGT